MTDGSGAAGDVELRVIGREEAGALQAVFERAGDHFLRVTGRAAPAPDAAERELAAAESTSGRGVALIVRGAGPAADEGASPLGAIGWWAGHPEPELALLGMLMVVREARGQGLARGALLRLEGRLRGEGITRLRTAVGPDDHESRGFLEALGFRSMDQRTRVDVDAGRIRIAFFEKAL